MSYARNIGFTIDHTQVGGSDLTNFNVVVRGTFPELRTVANGGQIQNLDTSLFAPYPPADFVISPNADGSSKYYFEIGDYDATTGYIEVYFGRPTVSASVDGTFYFAYDDPTVTTYQGSPLGAKGEWDANYKTVYHFANGFPSESTNTHAEGDVSGATLTTGVVGDALSFAGGSDVVDVSLAVSGFAFPNYARPMTFEFWLQLPSGGPAGGRAVTILQASSFSGNFLIYVRPDFEGKGFATVDLFTASGEAGIPCPTDGAWHHYMFAVNASGGLVVTFDGVQQSTLTMFGGALSPNTSTAVKFGNGFAPLVGKLDEVRFSNAARPAGWGRAAYNNQKSGSTFVRMLSVTAGYRNSQRFTIDHTQVGGSDLTDFNVVVRGTFPELRSVANGGQIQNLDTSRFPPYPPADFVVAPNQDGSSKYDFEIGDYDATTGYIEVYFRRPTVSASVDGTFYFAYDDPTVTTYQGTNGEWDANYKAVYHFANGSPSESTRTHADGAVSGPTQTAGVVGDALSFAGGSNVVDVPTFPNYARPMTFEFWLQLPSGGPAGGAAVTILQASSFSGNFLIYVRPDFEGKGFATVDLFTASGELGIPCPTDGAWHHYMFAVNASGGLVVTFDGVQQSSLTMFGGALSPNTSTAVKFGNGFAPLVGKLDEVRFSNVARPAGWGTAAYKNQKLGSTFVTAASPLRDIIPDKPGEQEWDEYPGAPALVTETAALTGD